MSNIIVHVCAESALAWLCGPALTLQRAEKDDSALRVYASSCEELKLHMAKESRAWVLRARLGHQLPAVSPIPSYYCYDTKVVTHSDMNHIISRRTQQAMSLLTVHLSSLNPPSPYSLHYTLLPPPIFSFPHEVRVVAVLNGEAAAVGWDVPSSPHCVRVKAQAGRRLHLAPELFFRMALRPAQHGFRMRTDLWKGKLCVDCAQPLSLGRRVRADAGHLSGGVADMVRQGMGRCAKTVPASTSDLLALDQHACAIQPANTPLYAAGPNSKPCPAPLLLIELMDQRVVLLSHTSIRVLLPSLPPHTKPLPAVPTSITAPLRYTSIVAPGNKGACQGVLWCQGDRAGCHRPGLP
ncbi:hypothetical protein G5714_015175 [Onychostoma macrolepis]|uniref:Uncharacterized protein n=1 Tax=Onychostoma macrolepis TaxID=369639 RepID=A0A7J6CA48_9TELE|nr:hypothetical protein G5714_015175 [Onychostoma macrolepis]